MGRSTRSKSRRAKPIRRTRRNAPAFDRPVIDLTVIDCQITWDPLPDPQIDALGPAEAERIRGVIEAAVADPANHVEAIEQLIEQYPDIPQFYNHLAAGLNARREAAMCEALIEFTYRRFPDYLFARCNYAMQLIDSGRHEHVPAVFGGKWHLRLLYPRRRLFHVTEVIAFTAASALYFIAAGMDDPAETCYDLLRELAPDHPMTREVQWRLAPSLDGELRRLWAARAGR